MSSRRKQKDARKAESIRRIEEKRLLLEKLLKDAVPDVEISVEQKKKNKAVLATGLAIASATEEQFKVRSDGM